MVDDGRNKTHVYNMLLKRGWEQRTTSLYELDGNDSFTTWASRQSGGF